jgi:hypothetical protein
MYRQICKGVKIQWSYVSHRNFQNIEETARDILVNELIAPRTAAFKNIQIDATTIFIKRKSNQFYAQHLNQ